MAAKQKLFEQDPIEQFTAVKLLVSVVCFKFILNFVCCLTFIKTINFYIVDISLFK